MIDFVVTYPCYSPMRSPTEPCTFTAGEDQCVAIITDSDLLDQFLSASKSELIRTTMLKPEALVYFLEQQSQCTKKGRPITHVLIDPGSPSTRARCYPISEFVQHILASELEE